MIVTARDDEEVAAAVGDAAERGMRVAVVSGGHSWPAVQLRDGGALMDLSSLDAIEVDVERRRATVGPGVSGGRLEAALRGHGLAFPFGHSPAVTVGGFLLAGGLGWNPGTWGPACHSVSAVDLVLATGETVRADADNRPELLWAARGAGPAFPAIVTRFHLELQALPKAITATTVAFPLSELEGVADWASALVDLMPRTVEIALRVARVPGRDEVAIRLSATAFANSPEEAATALAPVHDYPRARVRVEPEATTATSLARLQSFVAGLFPEGRRYAAEAIWSDAPPRDILATLARHVGDAPSPHSLGTAVIWPTSAARTTERAAFSRMGRTFVACYGAWDDERRDASNLAWHERAKGDLATAASGYYVGETDVLDASRVSRCFEPETWERLQRLRSDVDPRALFHSIPPDSD